MSKPKSDFNKKKLILRFPEDHHPTVSVQHVLPLVEKNSQTDIIKDVEPKPIVDLSVPKLNSTLCVKKKIKRVEEKTPRRFKTSSEIPQPERTSFDEKITKQMNFPFDKKLYKHLISLKLVDKPVLQQATTSHEPILRDKVPRLEDFYTPPLNFEYSIPSTIDLGARQPIKQYDGLRLHKVMKTWKDNTPD